MFAEGSAETQDGDFGEAGRVAGYYCVDEMRCADCDAGDGCRGDGGGCEHCGYGVGYGVAGVGGCGGFVPGVELGFGVRRVREMALWVE